MQSFLNGELSIPADEAFHGAVHSYLNVFVRCECVASMVQRGGLSTADFRDVFRNNIERRIRGLPEIDGLPKETVISSWMGKFDQIMRGDEDPRRWSQRQAAAAGTSERQAVTSGRQAAAAGTSERQAVTLGYQAGTSQQRQAAAAGTSERQAVTLGRQAAAAGTSEATLSKEQLFDLFQNVLGVRKHEHQILYNAMQVSHRTLHTDRHVGASSPSCCAGQASYFGSGARPSGPKPAAQRPESGGGVLEVFSHSRNTR